MLLLGILGIGDALDDAFLLKLIDQLLHGLLADAKLGRNC